MNAWSRALPPTNLRHPTGAWAVLDPLYPNLRPSRRTQSPHRRPDGQRVKYLRPTQVPAPARVGWLVFPRYQPGATLRRDAIDRADAFGRLIAEAHSPMRKLRGAAAFDLRYGARDDAVAAVIALTDR